MPKLRIYDRFQSWLVHPIAEGITYATQGAYFVWDHYFALVGKSKENEDLKKEIESLESQLLDFTEFKNENDRLKTILKMSETKETKSIAAQIIGQDPSGESMSFFINVGSKHGIKPRMAVVSPLGAVGTIVRVYSTFSLFRAIQDPNHAVDGMILRSRAQFIVEGRGKSLSGRLKYLDRSSDIRVGDLVITSGLDGVFAKGLQLGFIIKIDRPRTGVMQVAELRPTSDLSYLEEVSVVLETKNIAEQANAEQMKRDEISL